MSKALTMGKSSAVGSVQLFVGKILSTAMLMLGTIILGMLISERDYGLYSIALIPAFTALLFQEWGVSSAIAKHCASSRAKNEDGNLRKVIVTGLVFEGSTGLALAALTFALANFISSIIGKPESSMLVAIASISILSTSFLGLATSIFIGFERMNLSVFAMVCQAITQCMVAPLLVYLGYGALGAMLGYTVASVAASIMSVALLYFAIFKKLGPDRSNYGMRQTLKPLLRYGVPLAISAILGGLLTQSNSILMALFVKDAAIIGNYAVATNFAIMITFLTIPVSTVLFPAFSKLDPMNEQHLLRRVFESSVKYTSLLIVPATMGLMVLSKTLIRTIYADKWLSAPFFLAFYVVGNLFMIFGTLSMSRLLYGLGETRMVLKLNLLTICFGIPLAFILIPPLGISGLILGTILAGIPSTVFGLYQIWKKYGVKAELKSSVKIVLASAAAATATYFFLNTFVAASWITLIAGSALFLGIYLIVIPIIHAINQTDVTNLRLMFSGLGIISTIIEIPLTMLEKPLKFWDSHAETFGR